MVTFLKRLFGRSNEATRDSDDIPEELWQTAFKKPSISRFIEEGGEGYQSTYCEDGFRLDLTKKSLFAWTINPLYRYKNFVIEATLKVTPRTTNNITSINKESSLSEDLSLAGTAAGGFIFRYLSATTFYAVLLSDKGMIRMDALINGNPVTVLGWTETKALLGKENNLRIIACNTSFTIIVNDVWVAECSDDTIQAAGKIALTAQNWSLVPAVSCLLSHFSLDSRPFEIEAVHSRWNNLMPILPEARVTLAATWLAMGSYVPAILQLKKVKNERPLSPSENLILARSFQAQRMFKDAEREFRHSIESKIPDDSIQVNARIEAMAELGGIFYLQDRYLELESLLAEIQPDLIQASAYLSNLQGHLLHFQSRHDDAAICYARAGELAPDEGLFCRHEGNEWKEAGYTDRATEAWLKAGRRYLALNQTDELEALLVDLKKITQDDVRVLALAGKFYYAREEIDEALINLEKAADESCTDSAVWYILALIQREKGHITEAIDFLTRARDLEPNYGPYRFRLAETLRNDGKDYTAELASALETDKNNGWVHNLAALAALDNGDPDAAEVHAKEARRLLPNERDIIINLAEIHRRQGRLNDALNLLDKNDPRELHAGANILVEEKNHEEADTWYREALHRTPYNPEILTDRAANCIELDLLNEADDLLGRAYDLLPSPRIYLLISFLAGKKGEFTRSEIALQQGLAEFPKETFLLRELARVYLHTNRAESARKILTRLTSVDDGPETQELARNIEEKTTQKIDCSTCDRYWRVPRELPPQGSLHLTAQPPDNLPAGTCPTCHNNYCIECAKKHLDTDGRFRCAVCGVPIKLIEPGIIWLLNCWQEELWDH